MFLFSFPLAVICAMASCTFDVPTLVASTDLRNCGSLPKDTWKIDAFVDGMVQRFSATELLTQLQSDCDYLDPFTVHVFVTRGASLTSLSPQSLSAYLEYAVGLDGCPGALQRSHYLAILHENPSLYTIVPEHLKTDAALLSLGISAGAVTLCAVPAALVSEELLVLYMKVDGSLLHLVPEEMRTAAVCSAAEDQQRIVRDLAKTAEKAQQALAETQRELQDLKQTNLERDVDRWAQIEGERTAAWEQVDRMSALNHELQEALSSHDKTFQEASLVHVENQQLRGELEQLRSQLHGEQQALRQENERQRRQAASVMVDFIEASQENDALKEKLLSMSREKEELKARLTQECSREELQNAQQRTAWMTAEIRTLQETLTQCSGELTHLKQRCQAAENYALVCQSEVEKIKAEYEEKRNICLRWGKSLQAWVDEAQQCGYENVPSFT